MLLFEVHILRALGIRRIIEAYPYLASLDPCDNAYSSCLSFSDNIACLINHYSATSLFLNFSTSSFAFHVDCGFGSCFAQRSHSSIGVMKMRNPLSRKSVVVFCSVG